MPRCSGGRRYGAKVGANTNWVHKACHPGLTPTHLGGGAWHDARNCTVSCCWLQVNILELHRAREMTHEKLRGALPIREGASLHNGSLREVQISINYARPTHQLQSKYNSSIFIRRVVRYIICISSRRMRFSQSHWATHAPMLAPGIAAEAEEDEEEAPAAPGPAGIAAAPWSGIACVAWSGVACVAGTGSAAGITGMFACPCVVGIAGLGVASCAHGDATCGSCAGAAACPCHACVAGIGVANPGGALNAACVAAVVAGGAGGFGGTGAGCVGGAGGAGGVGGAGKAGIDELAPG